MVTNNQTYQGFKQMNFTQRTNSYLTTIRQNPNFQKIINCAKTYNSKDVQMLNFVELKLSSKQNVNFLQ